MSNEDRWFLVVSCCVALGIIALVMTVVYQAGVIRGRDSAIALTAVTSNRTVGEATTQEVEEEATTEGEEAATEGEEATTQKTPADDKWVTVERWTGRTSLTTPKFTVGNEWAIRWSVRTIWKESFPTFSIDVRESDGSPYSLEANVMEDSEETSYHHDAGTYYLDVSSSNAEWEVEILEPRQ